MKRQIVTTHLPQQMWFVQKSFFLLMLAIHYKNNIDYENFSNRNVSNVIKLALLLITFS